MSSGWGVYYVLFLSAGMALGIPAVLWVFSRVLSQTPEKTFYPSEELLKKALPSQEDVGRRMNTRFFLSANAALLLLGLAFLLIPCIVTLRGTSDADHSNLAETVFRGVVAIVSIAGFASLGLLYAARKGDLSWLKSYPKAESPEGSGASVPVRRRGLP